MKRRLRSQSVDGLSFDDIPKLLNEALGLIKQLPIVPSVINEIEAGVEFIKDVVDEIPSTIDDLLKIIQGALDGGIGDLENLIGQLIPIIDGADLPPNLQQIVDQIKQFLGDQQPIGGQPSTDDAAPATDDAPATPTDDAAAASTPAEPTTPEIEVGNATTLPAPVPEPEDADKPLEPKTPAAPAPQEETTPLQDYATYEATKDISDPNTAAMAGAAAAQVAGALQ